MCVCVFLEGGDGGGSGGEERGGVGELKYSALCVSLRRQYIEEVPRISSLNFGSKIWKITLLVVNLLFV